MAKAETPGDGWDEIMEDLHATFRELHPSFPVVEVKFGGEREAIEGLRALLGENKAGDTDG